MNKKIFVSIGIIAVLLAYVIYTNMDRSSGLPELTKWEGAADEIIINKIGSTIKIFNKNGKWLINDEGYPGDSKVINNIENKIKNLKVVDLISKKEYYSKYKLTPDKAISVIVRSNGKDIRSLLIGKTTSTRRHTYIRLDNKPGVYLVSGTFERDFNLPVDELRDKDIFKVTKKAISYLEIKNKNSIFAFRKIIGEKGQDKIDRKGPVDKDDKSKENTSEERWICKGYEKAKLSNEKIDSLLSTFNQLRASTYPEIDIKSLKKPVCSIKLKAYGREILLKMFYKINNYRYISTSSESPYVFTLDELKVKKLFINNIEDFKEKK